jgi:hypothetical protein
VQVEPFIVESITDNKEIKGEILKKLGKNKVKNGVIEGQQSSRAKGK